MSLLFNTDGMALFRSSKVAIWPIWTVINELPPNQRTVGMGGMEQIAQPLLEVLSTCCEYTYSHTNFTLKNKTEQLKLRFLSTSVSVVKLDSICN